MYGSTYLQSQHPGRVKKEDHKFEASLASLARPCLKIK